MSDTCIYAVRWEKEPDLQHTKGHGETYMVKATSALEAFKLAVDYGVIPDDADRIWVKVDKQVKDLL